MSDTGATALAGLAVVLLAAAVVSMALGELLLAGFCFLTVSLVIYFREKRLSSAR